MLGAGNGSRPWQGVGGGGLTWSSSQGPQKGVRTLGVQATSLQGPLGRLADAEPRDWP